MFEHHIKYYDKEKTNKQYEAWQLYGVFHREDGPAAIWYYADGGVEREYYYIKGKKHRKDGPACIRYNKDDSISCEIYYLNNQKHTEEEWFNTLSIKQKVDYLLRG